MSLVWLTQERHKLLSPGVCVAGMVNSRERHKLLCPGVCVAGMVNSRETQIA